MEISKLYFKEKFNYFIDNPISIVPLVSFRIVWGLLLFISTTRFILLGWIDDQYIQPQIHFAYYGFEWVKPLSTIGLYMVFGGMIISAIGIILGCFYRIASILFFLCFTYIELLDISYYLNHYYFVSIISFIMIWLPANKYFSIDTLIKPSIKKILIPAWCINVLKLQLMIVYFYAGLAKINTEWLFNAMPLKIWLPAHTDIPLIGTLFQYPITAYAFSWMGMIYDITIPFFLVWKTSRPWAFLAIIVFHCLTGVLFQIGVFPIVMIFAATIFFSNNLHLKILNTLNQYVLFSKEKFNLSSFAITVNPTRGIIKILLIGFFIFQLIFPWRYMLYPGNLFWTEEGYRFSWRVMLMEKAGTATFFVKDSITKREGVVDNSQFLNLHQEKQMAFQPDMILQYAHFLYHYFKDQGVRNPEVRAEIYVTLNGKPSRLFIDPNVNLALVKDGWKHKDWILALDE
ncbi:MAG: HTTM domain-containing protein [Cytophagales bacterium]|nr:MAG: HTTM domain-containing protein [Cytophagales bacterium]